jgi:hypothetical protein
MQYDHRPTDELLIYKNVPYVQMDKKMSCWFASAEMLFLFRRPNADFREHLRSTEGGQAVLEQYNKGLSIDTDEPSKEGNLEEWALLTRGFGMQELKSLPTCFVELVGAIREYGPLWCAGTFFQGSSSKKIGHIVTVIGAFRRDTKQIGSGKVVKTDYVIFHDPAPLKFNGEPSCIKQYDAWFTKQLYDPHVTNGESPIMHLPDWAIVMKREPSTYSGLGVGRKESVR